MSGRFQPIFIGLIIVPNCQDEIIHVTHQKLRWDLSKQLVEVLMPHEASRIDGMTAIANPAE